MKRPSHSFTAPAYDPGKLRTGVVHLGFGAFHRAHQACYFDRLAEETGETAYGIAVVNLRREDSALFREDTRHLPYVLSASAPCGAVEDRLIRIHTEALDWSVGEEQEAAEILLADPDVALVTITVSEGGYCSAKDGGLDLSHPAIVAERDGGTKTTVFAYLRAALNRRRLTHGRPVTVACCDNIRENGHMLEAGFKQYLAHFGDKDLQAWISGNVSFPNSMVDRITPKPPRDGQYQLPDAMPGALGPTIIAEDFTQWVIEDNFAGPKPPLHKVGVTVTKSVTPYEETKIRVLNGGHTALTYMGALAGFETFDEAFASTDLNEHFDRFEAEEVAASLPDDLPFDAHEYIAVISDRFSNRYIGDTIERICSSGFAKFPIFIRPTLENCFSRGKIPVHAIRSVASWVVFSRRVFSDRLDFNYVEPDRNRLMPLVQNGSLDAFADSEALWGDLASRYPRFRDELERQVNELEQRWPG